MIVSASRRTDIPALYPEWLINRIRAGFCLVPNPYSPRQISRLDLTPREVEAIVFWSKNPAPMLRFLPELETAGHRFYFQFTLNAYPRILEPGIPPLEERIATFRKLAKMIGPQRIVWRYDPIIISNITDWKFHARTFAQLCSQLGSSTRRVMISLLDMYAKTDRRLNALRESGVEVIRDIDERRESEDLLRIIARTAHSRRLEIFSCAERKDFSAVGIPPGRCIDGELIERLWGIHRNWIKDAGQREPCCCVESRDIGVNNTCTHNCPYCYATGSPSAASARRASHDPKSPLLVDGITPATSAKKHTARR